MFSSISSHTFHEPKDQPTKTKQHFLYPFNQIQTSTQKKHNIKETQNTVPGRDKSETGSRKWREIDSTKRETRGTVTQSRYDGLTKTPSKTQKKRADKKS